VAGAIAGFFFGFFLSATLLSFGVIPLKSPWVTILPAAFIVLGALWGYWAPIGRKPAAEQQTGALVREAIPTTPRPIGSDPTPAPRPPMAPPPPAEPGT
jgi:hypothetical protein